MAATIKDKLNNQDSPVTIEHFRKAIQLKERKDSVVIMEHQTTQGSNLLNSYGGVGAFVSVKAKVGSRVSEYELFVKTTHKDKARRQWLLEIQPIFPAETKMYSELIPAMLKMQTEKCGYIFGPSVPEYYHSFVTSETGIIILRNYQPDGYKVIPAKEALSYEHCELAMKEIAVFHALSWAMKTENIDYIKTHPFLSAYAFNEHPLNISANASIKSVIELVKKRGSDEKVKEAAWKLSTMNINQTMRGLCEPVEPFAVICHGDFHCHNIMFKNDESINKGELVQPIIIDMQIVNYALPTTDLAVLLYSSTTQDTRKRHLKDLLRVYHTEFIECLKKLKLTFEEFQFDVLEDMFMKSALFGVFMSCLFIPHLLCDREDSENYSQDNMDNLMKKMEEFAESIPVLCDRFPDIQARLLDNFMDIVEMGAI